MLDQVRAEMGPDPFGELLRAANDLPCDWAATTTAGGFQYLRCRLRFTQDELAAKSGLAQSLISRLEGGFDARLSTWRRVYAAMGFDLLLVPSSRLSVEALEARAEQGRPPGHWARERSRPRRRPRA